MATAEPARLVAPLDPRLDAATLFARDAEAALAASGTVERLISVAGHTARLRFAGDTLVAPLMRALQHVIVDKAATAPSLTVTVWDSVSTGIELSPLIASVVERAYRSPFDTLTPRHEIIDLSNDLVAATLELGSGVVTLLDRTNNDVVYWVRDPPNLPYYEQGAPFRTTLNWWLSGLGLHCIHAAAVGNDDGALLLTGAGGSGKSTTALTCINSGLRYLADDYCAFAPGQPPEVHSLYNTGKVRDETDLARHPHLADWVVNPGAGTNQKYLLFLAEQAAEQLLLRAPLRAIVLPRVSGRPESVVRPASAAEAMRALAPTSMFQLPGAADTAFFEMAALARQLPCYRLESGTNIAALPALLEQLLDDPASVVELAE